MPRVGLYIVGATIVSVARRKKAGGGVVVTDPSRTVSGSHSSLSIWWRYRLGRNVIQGVPWIFITTELAERYVWTILLFDSLFVFCRCFFGKDFNQAWIQTTATFALANLERFCYWKIGETLWKIGEILDKIGKPGNFKKVCFFTVSALEVTKSDKWIPIANTLLVLRIKIENTIIFNPYVLKVICKYLVI